MKINTKIGYFDMKLARFMFQTTCPSCFKNIIATHHFINLLDFRFPCLAALAKIYLAIPATEVASERAFSVAGLTLTKLRSTLDPDSVDAVIFVHKNYNFKVFFILLV